MGDFRSRQISGHEGRGRGKSTTPRGSLDFPLTVRDAPDEIPLTAQASKPNLNPESRDSPRNTARQQMTSGEGGLSDSTSRRKSGSLGPW